MINNCPKCGAPLQEKANFCPHCMSQFNEKQEIVKPKRKFNNKKKLTYIIISIVLSISLITGGTIGIVNYKKHSPICTYDNFITAVPFVSERMNINDLWDVNSFIDTHNFKEDNIIQYTATVNLNDSYLSLFFYNKGEKIYAYFCDIEKDDFEGAENILKCIAQSACNYYFTDIDDVFDNEKLYPKRDYDEPFLTDYTDYFVNKTDEYNSDIKNGASFKTRYITMIDGDNCIVYYITERNYNDKVLYDIALAIERQQ